MPQTIGWQAALPDILDAGLSVRRATSLDEEARARDVARRLAEAKRFPWWPLGAAFLALMLPNGWIWGGAIAAWWAVTAYRAVQRGQALDAQIRKETTQLRAGARADAERLDAMLVAANEGDRAALVWLLERWMAARPETIARFAVRLEGDAARGWTLRGEAIQRDAIPAGSPRSGRGGRTFIDKRKASEIDEDLAELNAAAVVSALLALFSGPTPQQVTVRVTLSSGAGADPIPWVTLIADLSGRNVMRAVGSQLSPAERIVALGGSVGRCRSQRLTPAIEITTAAAPPALVPASTGGAPTPATPVSSPAMSTAPQPAAIRTTALAVGQDPYGTRAVPIVFGTSTAGSPIPSAPPPPAGFVGGSSIGLSSAVPSPKNVVGEFSAVARKFATYPGDPSARFVAFQSYWSTYAHMAPGQLKFYFKWRHAARSGEAPRTDLSYIFVHVYELLHLIGAESAADAGRQVERLWTNYRATFPALDRYCVRWIADLYATEADVATATDFVRRAFASGADVRDDEVLLITDPYWISGDYAAMPRAGVAALTGDPRLGDNKFYIQHNNGPSGDGWVDRAYREAMAIADRWHFSARGTTLRDATMAHDGLRAITREAFQGAVYDWKRKPVALGFVPALSEGSLSVQTYRNAVRFAENLLRKERGFTAKLRGVEVDPALAAALDTHFGGYIKATKPKPKVTIDLAKAKDLARESADVRARLLDGIDVGGDAPTERPSPAPRPTPPVSPSTPAPATSPVDGGHVPPGLLTDLAAVQAAIGDLSAPAKQLLEALEAEDWEAPEGAPSLKAATGGALVGPLVDEINGRSVDAVGDVLIVYEGNLLVVQEDFRDEVYWVLKGTLDGFGRLDHAPSGGPSASNAQPASAPAVAPFATPVLADTDGFGPLELQALAIVARGDGSATAGLAALAVANATTPLLLVDRVNELALASSHDDIVIDADVAPPRLIEDATDYVTSLLDRVGSVLVTPAAAADRAEAAEV